MMRILFSMLILCQSIAHAAPPGFETGASLPRQKFNELEATYMGKSPADLINEMDLKYRMLMYAIRAQFFSVEGRKGEYASTITNDIGSPLVLALILAKRGFPRAAQHFESIYIEKLGHWSDVIIRKDGKSPEETSEMLSDLTEIVVVETLASMGYIKAHEMEAMYVQLDKMVAKLESEDGAAVKLEIGTSAVYNSQLVQFLIGISTLGSGFGIAIGSYLMGTSLIDNYDLSIGPTGRFFGSAAMGVVGAGVGGISMVRVANRLAARRVKVPDYKMIGKRCESLLTSSREILQR